MNPIGLCVSHSDTASNDNHNDRLNFAEVRELFFSQFPTEIDLLYGGRPLS